jgi:hypothetical protein
MGTQHCRSTGEGQGLALDRFTGEPYHDHQPECHHDLQNYIRCRLATDTSTQRRAIVGATEYKLFIV